MPGSSPGMTEYGEPPALISDSVVKERTSQRFAAPVLCRGPGEACLSYLLDTRGWSAARRFLTRSRSGGACASLAKDARPAALQCGFSVPGAVLPDADGERFRTLQGLSPPLSAHTCSQFVAAGLSASGRLPGASREQGYKPHPRAPHSALSIVMSRDDTPRLSGMGGF
jgi:hypothetical protein